jgi:hypothetical protein
MAIHDLWTFDHAPQGTTDVSTGSGGPSYSTNSGVYYQYSGNPGYPYNNGITNAIQLTTDGYMTMNSNTTSNPGFAIQAKEVQDWSVATQYWIGFRTKTSKQNASTANIFAVGSTVSQAAVSILMTEADLPSAALNQEYYVEIFLDRVNLIYQLWIGGAFIRQGTLASSVMPSGGNGFYWFGPWNSGLTANASRAFRDFYFVDVDATTPGRLGSIRSSLASLSSVTAPNYAVYNLSLTGSAAVSATQSKFGGSSLTMGGTTSSTCSIPDGSNVKCLSGDFTLECWAMSTNNAQIGVLFGKDNGGAPYAHLTYNNGQWQWYSDSSGALFTPSSGVAVNTWMHIALVKSQGTWYMYQNGVLLASAAGGTFGNNSVTFTLGNYGGLSNQWQGYIDEFRISNVARYTANFTPSTTPFVKDANTLLLMHFDASIGSAVSDDMSATTPLSVLQTAYPTPPVANPAVMSAPSDDPLTSSFNSALASAAKVIAVGYRVAAQSSSAANLNVSLFDGTNTQNQTAYAFSDTNAMKYGRRVLLATKAADGGSWTVAKVNATKLILTPTN